MCDNRHIGVVVEFANWEPFRIGSTEDQKIKHDKRGNPIASRKWRYRLFGHFDEMKIAVMDIPGDDRDNPFYKPFKYGDPRDFTRGSHINNVLMNITDNEDERMRFHPERSTIFLYTDYDDDKFEKLKMFQDADIGYDCFVAVVSIQFLRVFYDLPFSGQFECIEHYLEDFRAKQHLTSQFDFVMLKALSLDDACVLIKSRSVNAILECAKGLRQHTCESANDICSDNCGRFAKLTNPSDQESFAKRYNLYWEKLREEMPDPDKMKITNGKLERLCKPIRSFFQKKEKTATPDMNDKANRDELEQSLDKLLNVVYALGDFDRLCMSISYAWLEWIMKCRKAIRVASPMPLVRETHTIIGSPIEKLKAIEQGRYEKYTLKNKSIYKGTEEFDSKDDKVNFVILAKVHPGSDMAKSAEIFEDYIKCRFEFDIIDEKIMVRMGKHDLIYKNSGTADEARRMTEAARLKRFSNEIESVVNFPVVHIACNFYLDKPDVNDKTAEIRNDIHKEHVLLSETWSRERHSDVAKLFTSIRENTKDFAFLQDLINDHDLLYMKGVKRLYGTSVAYDYKGAANFFIIFYEQVNKVCKLISQSSRFKDDEKYILAREIKEGLDLALKRLSEFFDDRVVFDLAVRDNTRPSLYATGAYETLLNRYSVLVTNLKKLLACARDKHHKKRDDKRLDVKLDVLLIPVEYADIQIQQVFPIASGSHNLIFIEAPFDRMLEIHDAVPALCHELGHFLCTINPEDQLKVFVEMYAHSFSYKLTQSLCNQSYAKIPMPSVQTYMENLRKAIKAYLNHCQKHEKTSYNHIMKDKTLNLEHADAQLGGFIKEAFLTLFKKNPPAKVGDVHTRFKELCNVLGVLPLLHDEEHVSITFSVVNEAVEECVLIKRWLQECEADLAMIRTLELSIEDYLKVVIPNMARARGRKIIDIGNPDAEDDSRRWDTARILSSLIQINEPGHKQADELLALYKSKLFDFFDDISAQCVKAITDYQDIFTNKDEQEYWSDISKTLTEFLNDLSLGELGNEQLWLWSTACLYLLDCGDTLRKNLIEIENDNTREARILKNYRALYKDAKEHKDNKMAQMSFLLKNPEGWL